MRLNFLRKQFYKKMLALFNIPLCKKTEKDEASQSEDYLGRLGEGWHYSLQPPSSSSSTPNGIVSSWKNIRIIFIVTRIQIESSSSKSLHPPPTFFIALSMLYEIRWSIFSLDISSHWESQCGMKGLIIRLPPQRSPYYGPTQLDKNYQTL